MPLKGSQIGSGEVGASQIGTGAVTNAKLGADAVTSDKIAGGAVGTSDIAAGAVDTTALGADAVTAAKIAAGAVGTSDLAAGAVDTAALGASAVTAAKIAADVVGNHAEERQACLATSNAAGGELCGNTAIVGTPAGNSKVVVMLNGLADYTVGDGVKTADCYFSGDAGTTARAIAAIAAGDKLYSGSKANTPFVTLATSDELTFVYSKSVS